MMDYFAALRAFVRTADLGTFSGAAAELGVKVSTVSRSIGALETDLGAALFNRSTRGLHLTEIGTSLHERAGRLLADLDDARDVARSLNRHPNGLLRLNAPTAFGRRHIVPHLPAFLTAFPEIRIEVVLADAHVDLIESGTDVAVRIGALPDSALIARSLAPQRRLLVAEPGWLARHGAPAGPDDLDRLDCLSPSVHPVRTWHCRRSDGAGEPTSLRLSGRVSVNDLEALRGAALGGLGVALLPTWLVAEELRDGRLATVLPEWNWAVAAGPEPAIRGVYPPKKVVAPKVRAFLDFLARRFGSPPYWDAADPAQAVSPPVG